MTITDHKELVPQTVLDGLGISSKKWLVTKTQTYSKRRRDEVFLIHPRRLKQEYPKRLYYEEQK